MSDVIVPESRKTPFYPALDGLRAIAVLSVMLVHFVPERFAYGWVGVQIFFVLSGFLITGILFDSQHDAHRFRNFYARRTLRIFPLYYGLLFLLGLIVLLTHGRAPELFWLWFVYLQNFQLVLARFDISDAVSAGHHVIAAIGHLWSLAVEEQFYLLWPPIVFWLRSRRRLMAACLALIVLRMLLALYWQTHLPATMLERGFLYRALPTQCDGFLIGGWLALWLRGEPSPRIVQRSGIIAINVLACFIVSLGLLHTHSSLVHGQDVFDYRTAYQSLVGIPLSNLVTGVVLLAVVTPKTWAYRLCHIAPLRSLGRVSYGIYVFHLPVYAVLYYHGPVLFRHLHLLRFEEASRFVIGLGLTLLLSYTSFHFYEKRFLLLKNRFSSVRSASTGRLDAHPL